MLSFYFELYLIFLFDITSSKEYLLSFSSGNFLLVGPIGTHLGTLCKLALHMADIPIHHIDTSKQNTFFDGLRSAVRITGAEGKKLTVFFTVSSKNN